MNNVEIGSVWREKADGDEREVVGLHPENGSDDMVFLNGLNGGRVWIGKAEFLQRFEPVPDMVNHPPHYKDASGIECIEVTKHMQFCGGNCFKYLYRAGKKGSTVEDLKKAAWYAERAWIMNEIVSNEVFNKIFDIAHFRLGNIAAAMDSVRFNEWDMVEKHVRAEIARLESEAADD